MYFIISIYLFVFISLGISYFYFKNTFVKKAIFTYLIFIILSSIYIFYPNKFPQKYNQELKNQGYIKINSYSPKGGVEFIEGDTAFCKCDTILPIKETPFPQWDWEGEPFCGIFIIKAQIEEIIIEKDNHKTCKISISDWHPEYYIPKVDVESRTMHYFSYLILLSTVLSITLLITITYLHSKKKYP